MGRKLDKAIHRFVDLNYNFPADSTQPPSIIAKAKICLKGKLHKDYFISTDMIFESIGGKSFIIAKGLNKEPIQGTTPIQYAKEFGGFDVFDGHPNGDDINRKGKIWTSDSKLDEELKKDQSEREVKEVEYNGITYKCDQFACFVLEEGTDLIDFDIHWDSSITSGVRHGVMFPVNVLKIEGKTPVKIKGKTAYYESIIEQVSKLPWKRCDNLIILKASAGYPDTFPKPDPFVERVISCLLEYDHGSDREANDDMRNCYKIVDKIIKNQISNEKILCETLELEEKHLVAISLIRYLSTTEITEDDSNEIYDMMVRIFGM